VSFRDWFISSSIQALQQRNSECNANDSTCCRLNCQFLYFTHLSSKLKTAHDPLHYNFPSSKKTKNNNLFITHLLSTFLYQTYLRINITHALSPSASILSNNIRTVLSRGKESLLIKCWRIFVADVARKLIAYGSHKVMDKSPSTCSWPLLMLSKKPYKKENIYIYIQFTYWRDNLILK
jgi:hypothetical protein